MCNLHNQLINSCFWIVLQYGNFQSGNSKQTLTRLWMIEEYDYLPTSLSRPRRTQKRLHSCVRAKFSKTILPRFPTANKLWNRILINIRLQDADKLQDHHSDLFHDRKCIFVVIGTLRNFVPMFIHQWKNKLGCNLSANNGFKYEPYFFTSSWKKLRCFKKFSTVVLN